MLTKNTLDWIKESVAWRCKELWEKIARLIYKNILPSQTPRQRPDKLRRKRCASKKKRRLRRLSVLLKDWYSVYRAYRLTVSNSFLVKLCRHRRNPNVRSLEARASTMTVGITDKLVAAVRTQLELIRARLSWIYRTSQARMEVKTN